MTVLNALGLAMVAIQAGMLWLTMGHLPAALLATTAAAAGCWMPLGRQWTHRQRHMADGAVILTFLLLWWVYFRHVEQRSYQYGANAPLAAALGLMMMQALRFHWGSPAGPGALFPILGVLALGCAADVNMRGGSELAIFYVGAMAYGTLAALYFAFQSPGGPLRQGACLKFRAGAMAACLLLSLGLANGTVWALNHSGRLMNNLDSGRFIGDWMLRSYGTGQRIALGNSPTVRIGSLERFDGLQANAIALEIIADEAPGYLRGQVYATFDGELWEALPRGGEAISEPEYAMAADSIEAVVNRPWFGDPPRGYEPANAWENLFITTPGGELTRSLTVYPARNIQRAMFTPESTGWVAMAGESVMVNAGGIVEAMTDLGGQPYRIFTTEPPEPGPLSEAELTLYTQMPDDLTPRIFTLAAEILDGKESPLEKARAVADHFTSNYQYSTSLSRIDQRDSVATFLFSSPPMPPAHCEYFAMGTTMLMRAAGVPARYVTGVVGWERHAFSDYWIVRNRDAHAWCEAWDPELGWFVVESTPANGLPSATTQDASHPLRDRWGAAAFAARRFMLAQWIALARLVSLMAETSLTDILSAARDLSYLQPLSAAVGLGALAVAALWYRNRFQLRSRSAAGSGRQQELRLLRQLSLMDRFVQKRYRLTRLGHRTPHAFAREIEAVAVGEDNRSPLADWYRSWAETRYRPTPEATCVDALEQSLFALQQRPKTPTR